MDENNTDHLEDWRQLEHLIPAGFAFLLPYIRYGAALILAGVAVFHALYISPRWVGVTTRQDEKQRGFSVGKLLYALCILVLLLVFPDRLLPSAESGGLAAHEVTCRYNNPNVILTGQIQRRLKAHEVLLIRGQGLVDRNRRKGLKVPNMPRRILVHANGDSDDIYMPPRECLKSVTGEEAAGIGFVGVY